MTARQAHIERRTGETQIDLELLIDGVGRAELTTGLPFFDHMLTLFARHSLTDLTVKATGDLDVDSHHTVEDVGIALGQAFAQRVGRQARHRALRQRLRADGRDAGAGRGGFQRPSVSRIPAARGRGTRRRVDERTGFLAATRGGIFAGFSVHAGANSARRDSVWPRPAPFCRGGFQRVWRKPWTRRADATRVSPVYPAQRARWREPIPGVLRPGVALVEIFVRCSGHRRGQRHRSRGHGPHAQGSGIRRFQTVAARAFCDLVS